MPQRAADETANAIEERIRQRAYDIYCERRDGDGTEFEDWLAAERELRSAHAPSEKHASPSGSDKP